jgi:CheY-like chemotaxis protein
MEKKKAATILLVESDDVTRPILKRNLQAQGYHLIVALDEEDALERVSGGRISADLLLFNVVGLPPEQALEAARRIHQSAEFNGDTAIVVMAEKYDSQMEGKDVVVGENEYVTYLQDAEQLHNLLARLLNPVRE